MRAMGSLADVTLGDIGRAIGRYRPVAVTVAIILLVLAIVPGPRGAALRSLSSPAPVAPAAPAGADPADEAELATTESTVADDDPTSTFGSSSSSPSFGSSPSSSSSDFSSDDSSSSEFSSDFSSPSSSTDFGSRDLSSTDTTAAPRPLTIVAAGWASATGATPVGSTGVPAGKLPVGKRIGQVDKYSFVRLDGDQKVLQLRTSAEGARTTTGVVGVSVCQITDKTWQEAENVPSDRAPKYDAEQCVEGEPAADGSSWSFNLLTFASPTDPRGFALVPTGASIDYQVNFERS